MADRLRDAREAKAAEAEAKMQINQRLVGTCVVYNTCMISFDNDMQLHNITACSTVT